MTDNKAFRHSPHFSNDHRAKRHGSASRVHGRERSRSPDERHRNHHRRRSPVTVDLPFEAQPMTKHDLDRHRSLFARYLDVQKRIDITALSDDEVKGRWKSFLGKWNRGELARGWYEPNSPTNRFERSPDQSSDVNVQPESSDEAEDDYGPAMPKNTETSTRSHPSDHLQSGPAMPSMHDLKARREETREEEDVERDQHRRELREERRADRKQQKQRLEELVPRAEAGTRERQLEKKREKAESNRTFAAGKDAGGDVVEFRDAELMGDEDGLAALKRMKKEQEKRKTEREIRREETLRARVAEREERMADRRKKEDKTMEMLKEMARARFGGGSEEEML